MTRDTLWVLNPCTKFSLDKTYRSRVTELGRLQFSIGRQLKVQFYVLGDKGD